MIKKRALVPLLFGLLWLTHTGCEGTKDDATPRVEMKITFRAQYDGRPLVRYQPYDYDTYWVRYLRFNAFMSNIALLKDGAPVRLSDIEWIDFTPDDAPTDTAVDVTLTLRAPEGVYTGIRLGYGVPPALDVKQPKDFPVGHPLSRENEYWIGWKGYIFNKIEGQVDLNKDGTFDGGLIYHCGSQAVFREYTFDLPIRVGANAPPVTVVFDLRKLFLINGQWLDLRDPYNHITSNDFNDVVIATKLMDNFRNATAVTQ